MFYINLQYPRTVWQNKIQSEMKCPLTSVGSSRPDICQSRWPAGWKWSSEWVPRQNRRERGSRKSSGPSRCWWLWRRGWRGSRPGYQPQPETPESNRWRSSRCCWSRRPSTPARCRIWRQQRLLLQSRCIRYSSQQSGSGLRSAGGLHR